MEAPQTESHNSITAHTKSGIVTHVLQQAGLELFHALLECHIPKANLINMEPK